MPLIATFADAFERADSDSLGSNWSESTTGSANANADISSLQLRQRILTTAGGYHETAVRTAATYDLAESAVFVQLVSTTVPSADATHDVLIEWELDGNNDIRLFLEGGSFKRQTRVNGVYSAVTTLVAYDSNVHKWLQLSHSGTTFTLSHSIDGASWTPFTNGSFAEDAHFQTTFPSLTGKLRLRAVANNATATTPFEVRWDNVNTLPDAGGGATPIADFADAFNRSDSTSLGTAWVETNTTGTGASTTSNSEIFNQQLRQTIGSGATTYTEAAVKGSATYGLKESALYIKLVSFTSANTAHDAAFEWEFDAGNDLRIRLEAGAIKASYRYNNGVVTEIATMVAAADYSASPATYAYWRISHSGSTFTFWTSPDAVTWTSRATLTDPGFAALFADLAGTPRIRTVGNTASGTTALTAIWDDFNTPPGGTTSPPVIRASGRGGFTAAQTASTTITVTNPGSANSDFLLLYIALRRTSTVAPVLTTPSGWDVLYGPLDGGGDVRSYLFYKRAGSEPASWSVAHDQGASGVDGAYEVIATSGASGINTSDFEQHSSSGSQTVHLLGTITPSVNNCLVLGFIGINGETNEVGIADLFTWPSGWLETGQAEGGSAVYVSGGQYTQTTAATLNPSVTMGGDGDFSATAIVALAPVAASGTSLSASATASLAGPVSLFASATASLQGPPAAYTIVFSTSSGLTNPQNLHGRVVGASVGLGSIYPHIVDDGTIQSVRFSVNRAVVGTRSAAPFTLMGGTTAWDTATPTANNHIWGWDHECLVTAEITKTSAAGGGTVVVDAWCQVVNATYNAAKNATTSNWTTVLAGLVPGDDVVFAAGNYGRFTNDRLTITGTPTATQPIRFRAASGATVKFAENASDPEGASYTQYPAHGIDNRQWLVFEDLIFRQGIETYKATNSSYCVWRRCDFGNTGQAAAVQKLTAIHHLWENCHVHDTGKKAPQWGEGFYIGTDDGDLNAPETSYGHLFRDNTGANIAVDGIEFKEWTNDSVIWGWDLDHANYDYNWHEANNYDQRYHNPIGIKGDRNIVADARITNAKTTAIHIYGAASGGNVVDSSVSAHPDGATDPASDAMYGVKVPSDAAIGTDVAVSGTFDQGQTNRAKVATLALTPNPGYQPSARPASYSTTGTEQRSLSASATASLSAGATSAASVRAASRGGLTGAASPISVTNPGAVSGDTLLVHLSLRYAGPPVVSTPAGWSVLYGPVDNTNDVRSYLWWKTAGASEPAAWDFSFTGATGGTVDGAWEAVVVQGSTASPIHLTSQKLNGDVTTHALADAGTFTPTLDQCLILGFLGFNGETSGTADQFTWPVGWSERGEAAGGSATYLTGAHKTQTTAATEDPSVTSVEPDQSIGFMVALEPGTTTTEQRSLSASATASLFEQRSLSASATASLGAAEVAATPLFRDSSTAAGNGATNPTVATPANAQAGDLMLTLVSMNPARVSGPAPGWTEVGTLETNAEVDARLYRKAVEAADLGATHTWPISGGAAGDEWLTLCLAYSGVDATTPIETVAQGSTSSAVTSPHPAPIVTTGGPNRRVVTFATADLDAADADSNAIHKNSGAAGWTERREVTDVATPAPTHLHASGWDLDATSATTTDLVFSTDEAGILAMYTVALTPGSGSGTEQRSLSASVTASLQGTAAATTFEVASGGMLSARGITTDGNGATIRSDWMYTSTDGVTFVPTYNGASYKTRVRGHLFNARWANALFQDEHWTSSNGGPLHNWTDLAVCSANTDRAIAALDEYKNHGVIAVSVSMQGGNPGTTSTRWPNARNVYGETNTHNCSAYFGNGTIKGINNGLSATLTDYQTPVANTWAERAKRLFQAAKDRQMAVIINVFYQRQDQWVDGHSTGDLTHLRRAIDELAKFCVANDFRHTLWDVANEFTDAGFNHAALKTNTDDGVRDPNQASIDGLIAYAQDAFARARTALGLPAADWRAACGASTPGSNWFRWDLARYSDVAFPHGNEWEDTRTGGNGLDTYGILVNNWVPRATVPIIMNEDDHFRDNPGDGWLGATNLGHESHALQDCLQAGTDTNRAVSWGFMLNWVSQYYGAMDASPTDDYTQDVWQFGTGGIISPTVNGTASDHYMAAVLDLIATETLSGIEQRSLSASATASLLGPEQRALSASVTASLQGSVSLSASATASLAGTSGGGTVSVPGGATIGVAPPLALRIASAWPERAPLATLDLTGRLREAVLETAIPGGHAAAVLTLDPRHAYAEQSPLTLLPEEVEDGAHLEVYAGSHLAFSGMLTRAALDGSRVEATGYGLVVGAWRTLDQGLETSATVEQIAHAALAQLPWLTIGRVDAAATLRQWSEFYRQPVAAVIEELARDGDGEVPFLFTVYERDGKLVADFVAQRAPEVPDYILAYDPATMGGLIRDWSEVVDAVRMYYQGVDRVEEVTPWFTQPGVDPQDAYLRGLTLGGSADSGAAAIAHVEAYLATHRLPALSGEILLERWGGLLTAGGQVRPGYLIQAGEWVRVEGYGTTVITRTQANLLTGQTRIRLGEPHPRSLPGLLSRLERTAAALAAKRDPVTGSRWRY